MFRLVRSALLVGAMLHAVHAGTRPRFRNKASSADDSDSDPNAAAADADGGGGGGGGDDGRELFLKKRKSNSQPYGRMFGSNRYYDGGKRYNDKVCHPDNGGGSGKGKAGKGKSKGYGGTGKAKGKAKMSGWRNLGDAHEDDGAIEEDEGDALATAAEHSDDEHDRRLRRFWNFRSYRVGARDQPYDDGGLPWCDDYHGICDCSPKDSCQLCNHYDTCFIPPDDHGNPAKCIDNQYCTMHKAKVCPEKLDYLCTEQDNIVHDFCEYFVGGGGGGGGWYQDNGWNGDNGWLMERAWHQEECYGHADCLAKCKGYVENCCPNNCIPPPPEVCNDANYYVPGCCGDGMCAAGIEDEPGLTQCVEDCCDCSDVADPGTDPFELCKCYYEQYCPGKLPTDAPVAATDAPTRAPTADTDSPTRAPTADTASPTLTPTVSPTFKTDKDCKGKNVGDQCGNLKLVCCFSSDQSDASLTCSACDSCKAGTLNGLATEFGGVCCGGKPLDIDFSCADLTPSKPSCCAQGTSGSVYTYSCEDQCPPSSGSSGARSREKITTDSLDI